MQLKNLALLALASLVSADNTVSLKSMDSTDRTIVWTGSSDIEDTSVPGGETVNVTVPSGWTGNLYSYSEGAEDTPGMLAEFTFNSYAGMTYYDVSAIVNPDDTEGVYQIYPADTESPVSGCQSFACDNAYYESNDVQTKASDSDTFIVTLGAGSISDYKIKARETENLPRAALDPNFVPGGIKARFTSALRWARRM